METLLVRLAAASDDVRACREKQQRHVKRSCALTSLNNQSAHLDVDDKQSISGEGSVVIGFDFYFQSKSGIIVPVSLPI